MHLPAWRHRPLEWLPLGSETRETTNSVALVLDLDAFAVSEVHLGSVTTTRVHMLTGTGGGSACIAGAHGTRCSASCVGRCRA